jgi:hypothetical protein
MFVESNMPGLSDKEIENLRANASRLSLTGKPEQKSEAARLLPIVSAEIERRTAERLAAAAAKRAARPKLKRPAPTSKAAASKAAAANAGVSTEPA